MPFIFYVGDKRCDKLRLARETVSLLHEILWVCCTRFCEFAAWETERLVVLGCSTVEGDATRQRIENSTLELSSVITKLQMLTNTSPRRSASKSVRPFGYMKIVRFQSCWSYQVTNQRSSTEIRNDNCQRCPRNARVPLWERVKPTSCRRRAMQYDDWYVVNGRKLLVEANLFFNWK